MIRKDAWGIPAKGPGSKLTLRQAAFCREYLVDLNADQAMVRAGYAKRTARSSGGNGAGLLRRPIIAREIFMLREKMASAGTDDGGVTPEMIMSEFKKLGFSDMGDYITYGPGGIVIKPSEGDGNGKKPDMRCIQSAKQTMNEYGANVSIGLYDKVKALNHMAEILGMKKSRLEHLFPGGTPIIENVFYGDVKLEADKVVEKTITQSALPGDLNTDRLMSKAPTLEMPQTGEQNKDGGSQSDRHAITDQREKDPTPVG